MIIIIIIMSIFAEENITFYFILGLIKSSHLSLI